MRGKRITGTGLWEALLLIQTVVLAVGAVVMEGAQARNAGMIAVLGAVALGVSRVKKPDSGKEK